MTMIDAVGRPRERLREAQSRHKANRVCCSQPRRQVLHALIALEYGRRPALRFRFIALGRLRVLQLHNDITAASM